MPTFLVIVFSLLVLIFLHELGHFLVAKKYGVRVDEFGIGIPPRVFGKKIGETIYSINLIPLGGFVKLFGEDARDEDKRSFSSKPIYQRALIVFAGVGAFFVIAFLIFSTYSFVVIGDLVEEDPYLYTKSEIFITRVMPDSPADEAGIKEKDILFKIDDIEIESPVHAISVLKEKEGENVNVIVVRDKEEVVFSLTPRENPQEGEGFLGVMMYKSHPFYYSPVRGAQMTVEATYSVLNGFYTFIKTKISGVDPEQEMRLMGPVAIVQIGGDAVSRGFSDYLYFIGIITVSLAVLNILPIPALDGGRLMFLAIEKIKGSPISEKVEYGLNAIFFLILITLLLIVTYSDIFIPMDV